MFQIGSRVGYNISVFEEDCWKITKLGEIIANPEFGVVMVQWDDETEQQMSVVDLYQL